MPNYPPVSEPLKKVFDQYRGKVLDSNYFPQTPKETLCARITATYLLCNASIEDVHKAENLIKRTSINQKDLERLSLLSSRVTFWRALEIGEMDQQHFCKYKLSYDSKNGPVTVSYHAEYLTKDNKCLFNYQNSILLQIGKNDSPLTVTKGNFSLLATKPQNKEKITDEPLNAPRAKL